MNTTANLLALAGLAACAHTAIPGDPTPRAGDGADLQTIAERAKASVAHDLDRLAALDVFAVGDLLADNVDNAFSCYGECPDAAERVHAFVAQADRLHDLTRRAVAARPAAACELEAVEANLAHLRDLEIVEVGAFLHEEASANPNCYNLPCPEDVAAADANNCARSAHLAAIVAAVPRQ
jgi:hypothetical protein